MQASFFFYNHFYLESVTKANKEVAEIHCQLFVLIGIVGGTVKQAHVVASLKTEVLV